MESNKHAEIQYIEAEPITTFTFSKEKIMCILRDYVKQDWPNAVIQEVNFHMELNPQPDLKKCTIVCKSLVKKGDS